MKKKIVFGILILIIIALGITAYAFRDEINLVYTGIFVSDEKFVEKTAENKEKLTSSLDDYGIDSSVLDVDINALINGEVGEIELIEIPEETEEDKKKTEEEIKKNNCKQAIAKAVNEINIAKVNYSKELSAIEGEILAYYKNLRKDKTMTETQAKMNVTSTFLNKMLTFQKSCDDVVNKTLNELESVLKKNDGDTSIIKQVKTEYDNLKKAKMKNYVDRMENRLTVPEGQSQP